MNRNWLCTGCAPGVHRAYTEMLRNGRDEMSVYHASCLCGAVEITASGVPKGVSVCHCNDCRKHHGAAFYAAAFFEMDAVTVKGETRSYKGRHFCPVCGSSVYAVSPGEIEVHLGVMDGAPDLAPTYELWVKRRLPWQGSIREPWSKLCMSPTVRNGSYCACARPKTC